MDIMGENMQFQIKLFTEGISHPVKYDRSTKRRPITQDKIKGYKDIMFQKGLDISYLELDS